MLPETFSALVVNRELQSASSGRPTNAVTSHVVTDRPHTTLPLDGVTVRVAFSALTYADAVCVLGKDAGARDYPCVPGSDLVGVVLDTDRDDYDYGDEGGREKGDEWKTGATAEDRAGGPWMGGAGGKHHEDERGGGDARDGAAATGGGSSAAAAGTLQQHANDDGSSAAAAGTLQQRANDDHGHGHDHDHHHHHHHHRRHRDRRPFRRRRLRPGDRVVAIGGGLGSTFPGGFAQYARVPSELLWRLPDTMSTLRAIQLGTAGVTAMLAVMAIEKGVAARRADDPDGAAGTRYHRPMVLVSGGAGSVGGLSIAILHHLGFKVVALTRSPDNRSHLARLGARRVVTCAEFLDQCAADDGPLAEESFDGYVDTLGAGFLERVLPRMKRGGTVVSCGAICGHEVGLGAAADGGSAGAAAGGKTPIDEQQDEAPTSPPPTFSLLPFFRRGVQLVGVDSRWLTETQRDRVWRRLSTDVPESLFEDGMEARCFPQARLAQMLALAGRKVKGGGAGVITVVVQSELG